MYQEESRVLCSRGCARWVPAAAGSGERCGRIECESVGYKILLVIVCIERASACPPVAVLGGNTEKWDPPDGPCFHTEREELSLSFQTLQKSLKNIKIQNGDRKTPAPQRSRLLSSQMRQVRPLAGKRMMAAKEKPRGKTANAAAPGERQPAPRAGRVRGALPPSSPAKSGPRSRARSRPAALEESAAPGAPARRLPPPRQPHPLSL